jgi:hypothetical protein
MPDTAPPAPVAAAAPVRSELRTAARPAPPTRRTVPVAFSVPPEFGGSHAELIGEFLSWSPVPMDRDVDGRFSVVVHLEAGRTWRYRFLLDGDRLVNDPMASDYVPCRDGGYVSVVAV